MVLLWGLPEPNMNTTTTHALAHHPYTQHNNTTTTTQTSALSYTKVETRIQSATTTRISIRLFV